MSISTTDRLVRMANQIAINFQVRGEAVAIAETAEHIKKFWDPRMRAGINDHIAAGGEGLNPIALAALKSLAAAKA